MCMQTEACSCGLIAALIAMLKADDSECQAAAAALLHVLAAATQISRYCCYNQCCIPAAASACIPAAVSACIPAASLLPSLLPSVLAPLVLPSLLKLCCISDATSACIPCAAHLVQCHLCRLYTAWHASTQTPFKLLLKLQQDCIAASVLLCLYANVALDLCLVCQFLVNCKDWRRL